jgi:hypothetical protein
MTVGDGWSEEIGDCERPDKMQALWCAQVVPERQVKVSATAWVI